MNHFRRRDVTSRQFGALKAACVSFVLLAGGAPASASLAQDDMFDRLSEPETFMTTPVGQNGVATYEVAGLGLRFVYQSVGRGGTIRFVCLDGVPRCGETHKLSAEPATRGDTVLRDDNDTMVLRLTSAGGGTLFGGAAFVPPQVPHGGAAVVPVP